MNIPHAPLVILVSLHRKKAVHQKGADIRMWQEGTKEGFTPPVARSHCIEGGVGVDKLKPLGPLSGSPTAVNVSSSSKQEVSRVRMTQGKVLRVVSPPDVLMWQQGTRCC